MRTREQIEKQVKKERRIDNDIYDLRPDVAIELLLDVRTLLLKNNSIIRAKTKGGD